MLINTFLFFSFLYTFNISIQASVGIFLSKLLLKSSFCPELHSDLLSLRAVGRESRLPNGRTVTLNRWSRSAAMRSPLSKACSDAQTVAPVWVPAPSVSLPPGRSGAVCQKEPQADAAPTRGLPEREAGRCNPPRDVAGPSGPAALPRPGGARAQIWDGAGEQGKGDALHGGVRPAAGHGGRRQAHLSRTECVSVWVHLLWFTVGELESYQTLIPDRLLSEANTATPSRRRGAALCLDWSFRVF